MRRADLNAKRLGLSRRQFLTSSCGVATTLLAFNEAYANKGLTGGYYALNRESSMELDAAEALDNKEFIFDVQGHFVNPQGDWLKTVPDGSNPFSFMPKAQNCELVRRAENRSYLHCLGPDEFIKDVFLDSDTDAMVLSFVPSASDAEPLTIEEAAATRDIVEQLDGSPRLLIHGRVNPNQDGDMERMADLADTWKVSAWKTYTQWGLNGQGYFLTDDIGHAFIERAIACGVKNICVHKGIPFGEQSYQHSTCVDIGAVARQYPDVNFLVYHSGFVPGQSEAAYDSQRSEGIDGLINAFEENGRPKNVYAELGSTWRFLMRDPNSAAHTLGKLFKHMGHENILWGSDSIWYGSPQDQIQAFRTFQISEQFQEEFGYQAITAEMRAAVFGLNAARVYDLPLSDVRKRIGNDKIARRRKAYREQPNPHFATRGPRTRREFLNLMQWSRQQSLSA